MGTEWVTNNKGIIRVNAKVKEIIKKEMGIDIENPPKLIKSTYDGKILSDIPLESEKKRQYYITEETSFNLAGLKTILGSTNKDGMIRSVVNRVAFGGLDLEEYIHPRYVVIYDPERPLSPILDIRAEEEIRRFGLTMGLLMNPVELSEIEQRKKTQVIGALALQNGYAGVLFPSLAGDRIIIFLHNINGRMRAKVDAPLESLGKEAQKLLAAAKNRKKLSDYFSKTFQK